VTTFDTLSSYEEGKWAYLALAVTTFGKLIQAKLASFALEAVILDT
jgi:hypothetical protein